ncbi:hypothetical protein [Pseudomonas putida]|uniref:Uncharacterized protein n=1 Tax=Pseudomonas putida TaxID=303 RepID=A0A1B2F9X3_PSEPU|nr:hypothetical protein [Pseudomonas putida]ANY88926.1 hypothetical protein IEC33019_3401 [Pseudomonas putida]MDZ3993551.1 hypothetical protein [Pseudomonas sp. Teo4]
MIHQLFGIPQLQETPEAEAARAPAQARRQRGLTDADLADLQAQAFQLRQAREAAQSVPTGAAVEQYTLEVVAGGNAANTRRQRPGSSLGINT